MDPVGWFSIKMPSYQCRKSHGGDKIILWSSYLHKGISCTGTVHLYIGPGLRFSYRGPFHQWFITIQISFWKFLSLSFDYWSLDHCKHICQWHNSTAVLLCAEFHWDQLIGIWMRAKFSIWIVMEKLSVRWTSDPDINDVCDAYCPWSGCYVQW